jgi:hypothetical protein
MVWLSAQLQIAQAHEYQRQSAQCRFEHIVICTHILLLKN